jgi:hypothetical protein
MQASHFLSAADWGQSLMGSFDQEFLLDGFIALVYRLVAKSFMAIDDWRRRMLSSVAGFYGTGAAAVFVADGKFPAP